VSLFNGAKLIAPLSANPEQEDKQQNSMKNG